MVWLIEQKRERMDLWLCKMVVFHCFVWLKTWKQGRMKNKVGEVFHPGPSKTILPNGKESEEKMLSLLRIYCFVQYLISFLVIKKNHFSIFFLLISFSHVITLNLFKSYFMSFHFLHPYHLSNTYKKKIETFFFFILSTFSILTFLSYQQSRLP